MAVPSSPRRQGPAHDRDQRCVAVGGKKSGGASTRDRRLPRPSVDSAMVTRHTGYGTFPDRRTLRWEPVRLTTTVVSALLLTVAVADARSRQQPSRGDRVTASHGLSMHGDLKYGPGFKHFELRQPRGAQGRRRQAGRHRHLRHASIPSSSRGVPAAGARRASSTRSPMGSRTSRSPSTGCVAESIEVPRRPFVGRLHAPAGSALPRRQPDHRRGRHLDFRDAQGEGPAVLPQLLRPGRQGREGRRPQGQVHASGRARTASCR